MSRLGGVLMSMDSNVLHRMIDLSETGAVALMHMTIQAQKGKFEDTAELFRDFMEAFAEIEGVLLSSLSFAEFPQLSVLNEALRKSLSRLVECYERGDASSFVFEMNENVFRIYNDWQDTLKRSIDRSTTE